MLPFCPGKEPFGGRHVTPFAQEEICGATLFIDGAIKVNPLAAHLDIRLIHSPRISHRPRIMVPAFLKVWHVALHPTQDVRVGPTVRPSFGPGHGSFGLKRQVPPHAQHDEFVVKMTALEKFPCRGRFLHAGRYRREPSFSSLHQNRSPLLPKS